MIQYEKNALDFLTLPSLPKKEWDGSSYFKYGIAVITLIDDTQAYAIARYEEGDVKPHVIKVFGLTPFKAVGNIFVVPDYMDTKNVEDWDLAKEDKERVEEILQEAKDLENEGVEEETLKEKAPENEYFFDFIHDDEEAKAFIASYNKTNKIGGRIPNAHDSLIMRLGVIYKEQQEKAKA